MPLQLPGEDTGHTFSSFIHEFGSRKHGFFTGVLRSNKSNACIGKAFRVTKPHAVSSNNKRFLRAKIGQFWRYDPLIAKGCHPFTIVSGLPPTTRYTHEPDGSFKDRQVREDCDSRMPVMGLVRL